jgi:type II secretory pathway component PulF
VDPTARVYRSLASLCRAGVPWPQALETAAAGGWEDAQRRLAAGEPLSVALGSRVEARDVALLRAGEHTGRIEEVLDRLAERHEGEARRAARRRTALFYPAILVHLGAILLPLPDLLEGRPTRALCWALAALLPFYALVFVTKRHGARARSASNTGSRAPPRAFGPLRSAVEEADARALRFLADGLDAGLPLAETLDLAARAGAGGRAAFDLQRSQQAVLRGDTLTGSWQALPPEIVESVRAGEAAGEAAQAARREAARLEFEVEMRRQRIDALLPVLLVIVIGGIVAARLFAFYRGALERFYPG